MSATPWGVDLSPTYNPTVNAAAIKAAGASYAILKVSEGVGWPDATLHPAEFNWLRRVGTDVVAAGLELRVYHLATPLDRADALAEASWFDRHLALSALPVPTPASVAYDLESIPPGLTASACVDIYEAWVTSVRGFLPGTLIEELYCNRDVHLELEPFLTDPWLQLWLAWPGWVPGDPLPHGTMRVQVGQRTIPGVAGMVDVNVDPACSLSDLKEALGQLAPTPPPAPPPPPVAAAPPPPSSDWSLTVQTLDLRTANTTPVRGVSVKALQTLLKLATALPLAIDGIAGPDTRRVLGLFQTSTHGLAVDYIAGPATWEALCRQ